MKEYRNTLMLLAVIGILVGCGTKKAQDDHEARCKARLADAARLAKRESSNSAQKLKSYGNEILSCRAKLENTEAELAELQAGLAPPKGDIQFIDARQTSDCPAGFRHVLIHNRRAFGWLRLRVGRFESDVSAPPLGNESSSKSKTPVTLCVSGLILGPQKLALEVEERFDEGHFVPIASAGATIRYEPSIFVEDDKDIEIFIDSSTVARVVRVLPTIDQLLGKLAVTQANERQLAASIDDLSAQLRAAENALARNRELHVSARTILDEITRSGQQALVPQNVQSVILATNPPLGVTPQVISWLVHTIRSGMAEDPQSLCEQIGNFALAMAPTTIKALIPGIKLLYKFALATMGYLTGEYFEQFTKNVVKNFCA